VSLFVLIHDRHRQKIIELRTFSDMQRREANDYYSEAERRASRENPDLDVVLFQADSLEDLKRTHGSYFFSEKEMLDRAIGAL
jgi:hypothetical protein